MELLLIMTYAAICVTVFKVFRLPVNKWTVPTAPQEEAILGAWASLVPTPPFDYVYAWGSQQNDTALAQTPDLQVVFAAHMQSTCSAD